jgi:hypothetical protein
MKLTIEEHIENAKELKEARRLLNNIAMRSQKEFCKSSKVMKTLFKIRERDTARVKSLLDDSFCNLVTKEQLDEMGYIYYGEK